MSIPMLNKATNLKLEIPMNPQTGNRVILLVIAFALGLSSLFVPWGSVPLSAELLQNSKISSPALQGGLEGMLDNMVTQMVGMEIKLDGRNGRLRAAGVSIPYWIGISGVLLGLFMLGANLVGFSSVPKGIIGFLFVIGAIMALWALIFIVGNGTIGVGIFLIVGAVGIGLFQLARSSSVETA